MRTRITESKILAEAPLLLPGTIVERYLKCRNKDCAICREQGGHGPAYYLSIREAGRTRMIYIAKNRLREARKAVADYQRLRKGTQKLAHEELKRWHKQGRKQS